MIMTMTLIKRSTLLMTLGILLICPAFGADDDSTPYMPYPETPVQTQSVKPPAKKAATKKKAPAKKPAKKAAPKKAAKPKVPARPSSLQQGIALMEQERYEQAKPYLLKAIQEDRNNPNVWYWYGVYHEKTGGFHQAQYFYSKAITIDPAFEPLSRVVYYPEDSEKTPLWDPKRPARVYPVETESTGGLATVPAGLPGRSSFPEAPNDPELPHVPVYTPPEPGAAPFDGDAWGPAVYVPPSPEEIQTEGEMTPQYIPPEPQSIIAQDPQTGRQILEVPMRYPEGYYTATEEYEQPESVQPDRIIRADLPLYTPPNPGEKAPVVPKQTQVAQKQSTPVKNAKNADTKIQETSTAKRTSSVPASRVIRQSQSNKPRKSTAKAAPAVTTTRKTQTQPSRKSSAASRDVRPSRPQTQQRVPEPVTPSPNPEPVQYRPQNQEYMPPAGQFAPDPGTISENPLPPVGQGSQN